MLTHLCQIKCSHSFYTPFKIFTFCVALLLYCQIGDLQRWENNSKKYPFKTKFRKYHISAIKFFSPDLTKTRQWAKMTLEIMYTVSQPEKICNNVCHFSDCCLLSSWCCLFWQKDVIRTMIRPCQHEEIRSVQWYEVYPELVKLFLSKPLFLSAFVYRSSNQMQVKTYVLS